MPYISSSERPDFDQLIDDLAYAIKVRKKKDYTGQFLYTPVDILAQAGRLNYCMSRIIGQLVAEEKSYGTFALFSGVLDHISKELYRRLITPYEDKKIRLNGDIPEFKPDGE